MTTVPPKLILVMRYGEKSDDLEDPHLTEAGRARAKALATYIPETFGEPAHIIAAAKSKHSVRPRETVKPLSKKTGLRIDASIADNDYGHLARILLSKKRYAGSRVVVCWHHGNIPSLLHYLGAAEGSYPDPWKRDVFNLIVKVEFPDTGAMSVSQVIEPF